MLNLSESELSSLPKIIIHFPHYFFGFDHLGADANDIISAIKSLTLWHYAVAGKFGALTINRCLATITESMLPETKTELFFWELLGSGKWILAPVHWVICLMFNPPRPIMNWWCCGEISICVLTGNAPWQNNRQIDQQWIVHWMWMIILQYSRYRTLQFPLSDFRIKTLLCCQ